MFSGATRAQCSLTPILAPSLRAIATSTTSAAIITDTERSQLGELSVRVLLEDPDREHLIAGGVRRSHARSSQVLILPYGPRLKGSFDNLPISVGSLTS